jgi:hypothetical protein
VETLSLVTISSSTKFVALSYVWGSIPIFKTKTNNAYLLRTPGSLSGANSDILLPASIRDAISLTGKLGEKYLWVGCLCMVQDADSLGQSLRAMATIYAGAEFTICRRCRRECKSWLEGYSQLLSISRYARQQNYE